MAAALQAGLNDRKLSQEMEMRRQDGKVSQYYNATSSTWNNLRLAIRDDNVSCTIQNSLSIQTSFCPQTLLMSQCTTKWNLILALKK